MGTTNLLYNESNAAEVLLDRLDDSRIYDPNYKLGVKRATLSVITHQMAGFQGQLNAVLTESVVFTVYDANPTILVWKRANAKLLGSLYQTKTVQKSEHENSAVKTQAVASAPQNNDVIKLPGKFIVIGWITDIHERESRTLITDTGGKTAFIYNLDIFCEYRIINPDNQTVLAAFTASGHSGIARILGNGQIPVSYDMNSIVNDMFYSLAVNVRHSLLIKEKAYIKSRNAITKINAESLPIAN